MTKHLVEKIRKHSKLTGSVMIENPTRNKPFYVRRKIYVKNGKQVIRFNSFWWEIVDYCERLDGAMCIFIISTEGDQYRPLI